MTNSGVLNRYVTRVSGIMDAHVIQQYINSGVETPYKEL